MQVSGKPGKNPKFQLGVSESKLGSEIQETTNIPCVCNEFVGEIVRGLRLHISRFLKGLEEHDMTRSQLGLAHSYSRAKVSQLFCLICLACSLANAGCLSCSIALWLSLASEVNLSWNSNI